MSSSSDRVGALSYLIRASAAFARNSASSSECWVAGTPNSLAITYPFAADGKKINEQVVGMEQSCIVDDRDRLEPQPSRSK